MAVLTVLFVAGVEAKAVAETVAVTEGRIVNSSPDRTVLVFRSVSAALSAAARLAELGGAVGVEVGEPVEESASELFGLGVWVAARLCTAAEPGQAVVSGLARRLSGLTEARFTSLGTRELKGIPEPVAAFALVPGTEIGASKSSSWVALCVDQVGSTAQLSGLGDTRAGRVHVALLDVAREAAAERGGEEIEYAGDGLVFAFPSAIGALDAATMMLVGAQRYSLRHPDEAALRLRIGTEVADELRTARAIAVGLCAGAETGEAVVSESVVAVAGPSGLHEFSSRADGTRLLLWASTPTGLHLPSALQRTADEQQLLGRGQEHELLLGRWSAAASGQRSAVLITGDAGAGKTALARVVVAAIAEADPSALAIYVASGGAPGFSAVTSGWDAYLRATPRAELREQLSGVGGVLAEVLPVLSERIPDLSRGGSTNTILAIQALEVFTARVSDDYPLVMVFDDVHDADPSVVQLLRALGRGSAPARLMIMALARTGDFGESDVAADLGVDPRRSAGAEPGFQELALRGLSTDNVAALLTRELRETPDPDLVRSVDGESDGMPGLVLAYAANIIGRRAAQKVDRAARRAADTRMDLNAIREEIVLDLVHVRRPQAGAARVLPVDPEGTPPAAVPCPYKGLAAFSEEDGELFRGRDELVAQLIARLMTTRILAVVGASGSGKSSLVRAGLLATLSARLVAERPWQPVVFVPGENPVRALRTALAAVEERRDARHLLVVDQFEEVFGASVSLDDRRGMIDELLSLTADASDTTVVVVLRADFYGECAAYQELAAAIAESQLLVGPMTQAELRAAIELPATAGGLVLEPALTDAIVYDVSGEEGALPLVSTVLVETWQRRRGRSLTLRGYAEAGGVRGAVARLAEETYASLTEREQQVARELFLRLAEPAAHGREVRRRARRNEIDQSDPAVTRTLTAFVEHRLLIASQDTIEVAHEALLREWPRLREWLASDREYRKVLQDLAGAAVDWDTSGREPERLARGTRLAIAASLLETVPHRLSGTEREYVEASSARHATELARERRNSSRLRRLLAAAVALLLIAAGAGAVAFQQRSTARDQQAKAVHEATVADGRGLAAQATALSDKRLLTALLLAVEGYRRDPSDETEAGLLDALNTGAHLTRFLPQLGGDFVEAAVSKDGRYLFKISGSGTLTRFETATWRAAGPPLAKGLTGASDVAVSPRGDRVAVSAADGLHVYDMSGHEVAGPFGAEAASAYIRFSPDGTRVYSLGYGPMEAFDAGTGRRIRTYITPDGSTLDRDNNGQLTGQLSTDGRSLVIVAPTGLIYLDTDSGRERRKVAVPADVVSFGVSAVASSGLVAVDTGTSAIDLLDGRTGAVHGPPLQTTGTRVADVMFSADGSRLVASSDDGGIRAWDTQTGALLATMRGHSAIGGVVCLDPTCTDLVGSTAGEAAEWNVSQMLTLGSAISDGTTLVEPLSGGRVGAAGEDGMLRFYGPGLRVADPPLKLPVYETHGGGDVDAARATLVVAGTDTPLDSQTPPRAAAVTVDIAHRKVTHLFRLSGAPYVTAAAISKDGARLVIGGSGLAAVFDARSGVPIGKPVRVDSLSTGSLAWSADGSRFFTGGQDGVLEAWSVKNTDIHKVGSATLATDAFISDIRALGGVLAVAAEDGVVRLMKPTTLRVLQPTYTAGGTQLQTAGLDSAGDRVYATSRDGSLRIWDRASGRSVGPALAGNDDFSTALIETAPRRLYSAGGVQPGIVEWNLSPSSWLAKACRLAGRNLTKSEWNTYLPNHTYRKTCAQFPAGS